MSKNNYKRRAIKAHALKPETLMTSYGFDPHLSQGAVKPPVFLTSTFVFESAEDGEEFFNIMSGRTESDEDHAGGLIYSRFNHPNVEIVEDRLALWENAEASLAFSSGMGAISSLFLSYLRPGDVIAYSAPLYGGTETLIRNFLPQYGIEPCDISEGLRNHETSGALRYCAGQGRVAMIFVETPANPTNALIDFKALASAADIIEEETGHRPLLVCDNTLMGPVFQQVIPHGMDLAVYSLTKYIGGHSDLVAGAICGSKELLKPIRATRGALGLNLDPHTSWMIARSLETLQIRMERSAETGRKVAAWLADNPYIETKVLHPDFIDEPQYQDIYKRQCSGPGATFSFVIDAPKKTAFALINTLSIFKSAVSLGGNESLVCHPASTTHSGVEEELREQSGITDGLIRLSVGLENADDLIADLDNAFNLTIKEKIKMFNI